MDTQQNQHSKQTQLTVIQSQSIERLFDHLQYDMTKRQQSGDLGVFENYELIVPASSLKTWIMNRLAKKQGISAMVQAKFWGSYNWQLFETVLDGAPLTQEQQARLPKLLAEHYSKKGRLVPKNANLSIGFMQWRIFRFLQQEYSHVQTLSQKQQHAHPLHQIFASDLANKTSSYTLLHNNWWQLSQQIAKVYSAYLTHRIEWLKGWSATPAVAIDIEQLIVTKDSFNQAFGQSGTPEWLLERFKAVNIWQQYIWQVLFVDDFNYRQELQSVFWEMIELPEIQTRLPKQITFFTLPPMPKADLDFIRKIANYIDINFLHYNPSQEYWRDISDPKWIASEKLRKLTQQPHASTAHGEENESELFSDEKYHGHFLLARMGKQARDTFKLLSDLAGGYFDEHNYVEWQDDFVDYQEQVSDDQPNDLNLLQQIQQDILFLEESSYRLPQFDVAEGDSSDTANIDDSIRINACHSTTRQLEVLREDIVRWLNKPSHNGEKRQASDVLVMMPDVANYESQIRAIFPPNRAIDGISLPAQITGLPTKETQILWQAMSQYYSLLVGRFSADVVFAWLMLPPVYTSVGLSHQQMHRACELLQNAGFKRGFNAEHIAQTLNGGDGDERFTFAYALDKLTMGLFMPEASHFDYQQNSGEQVTHHYSVPADEILLEDKEIIASLVTIYGNLQKNAKLTHTNTANTIIAQPLNNWMSDVLLPDMQAWFEDYRGQLCWQEVQNALYSVRDAGGSAQEQQPLGLEFVLGIVGDALSNDMRGSEPTGAVTFCRIGTVRLVPYKLVVMLNLNIGEYPKREQPNYFDLMNAGLPQVGDRQREDDETGAFLDAMLGAKESCWFYYNGFSTADNHTHLPANPLQELIMFIESMYNHQQHICSANSEPNTDVKSDNNHNDGHMSCAIPQFIEHSSLPFSKQNFVADDKQHGLQTRMAGFWFDLFRHLQSNTDVHKNDEPGVRPFIDWQQQPERISYACTEPQQITGDELIRGIQKPAQLFLRQQSVAVVQGQDEIETIEPLSLNPLEQYLLLKRLLESTSVDMLQTDTDDKHLSYEFDELLPAGVGKELWLSKQKGDAHRQLQQAQQIVTDATQELITPTAQNFAQVQKHTVNHSLPENLDEKVWLKVSPSKSKPKYIAQQWIEHLLWHIARGTSITQQAEGVDGISCCVYKGKDKAPKPFNQAIIRFKPIEKTKASEQLQQWLAVWEYSKHTPFVLPPLYGMNNAVELEKPYVTNWLSTDADFIADTCSVHPHWQTLLDGTDALEQLKMHIELYAKELYEPMFEFILQDES